MLELAANIKNNYRSVHIDKSICVDVYL